MSREFRTLVIIPAYNEEKSIGRVIDKIQETTRKVDIVIVDDNSSDNTARIVQEKRSYVIALQGVSLASG